MTEPEINRIIHEKVMGKCWHEWEPQKSHWSCCGFATCKKCGANTDRDERDYQEQYQNPSYTSSWSDYGPMLEWAMKQEKIKEDILSNPLIYLNPLMGVTRIASLLGGQND